MNATPSASKLADRLFGLLIVIIAITYLYLTNHLPIPFGEDEAIGPRDFPYILGSLLGLPGLWLMVKPQPGEHWPNPRLWAELAGIVIVLVLFAMLLECLGFVATAVPCCAFISWRMGAKPHIAVLTAIGYATGLYLLFDRVLDLALPGGIFANLL